MAQPRLSGFEIDMEGVLAQAGGLDNVAGSPNAGIRRLDTEVRRGSGKNYRTRVSLVQVLFMLSGEGGQPNRENNQPPPLSCIYRFCV